MKEEKVYIVTSGEYSDYKIEAVFSDKGKAEEFVEVCDKAITYYDKYYKIEEYYLDIPKEQLFYTEVYMGEDGGVHAACLEVASQHIDMGNDFGVFRLYGGVPCFKWVVKTHDRERAIKVANEKRAQILALGIWGDEDKVREMVK